MPHGCRRPSAPLVGAAAVFLMGRRLYGRRAAFLAATLLIATPLYANWATMARMDMVMTAFLLVASCLAQFAMDRKSALARWGLVELGCIAAAAAYMTKGLVPLALAMLFMVVPWLHERRTARLAGIVALLLVLTTVAAHAVWAQCTASTPLLHGYWTFQTGGTGPKHQRGFFYYLLQLPHQLLPWSLWLPFAAVWWGRSFRAERIPARLTPLTIAAAGLLLLSISGNKRIHYALPLVPFLALAVAEYAARVCETPGRAAGGAIRWTSGAVLVALPLATLAWFAVRGVPSAGCLPLAALCVCAVAIPSVVGLVSVVRAGTARTVASVAVASVVAVGGVYPCAMALCGAPEEDIVISRLAASQATESIPVGLATVWRDDIAYALPARAIGLDGDEDIARFAAQPGAKYLYIDATMEPLVQGRGARDAERVGARDMKGKPSLVLFRLGNPLDNDRRAD